MSELARATMAIVIALVVVSWSIQSLREELGNIARHLKAIREHLEKRP